MLLGSRRRNKQSITYEGEHMSYKDSSGRTVDQLGTSGAAYVIIVDTNGNPVAVGGGSTDLTPLTTRYGDVSANPAANTVLGRLKDITNAVYAPKYSTVTIFYTTTSTTGTNFVTPSSLACELLTVINDTGTDIEYRRGGAGSSMVILAGQTYQISGITNANQLSFKRKDSSNTQVVIRAEAFKI